MNPYNRTIKVYRIMNMLTGIYKITSPSGEFYIGSANDILRRWKGHRHQMSRGKHVNPILNNIAAKYGMDAIEFDIIEICNVSILIEREQFYIDSLKPKYNINQTAGSIRGYKWTPEQKANLSSVHKGRVISEETKRKMSEAKKGLGRDCSTKSKISDKLKGRKFSQQHLDNLKAAAIRRAESKRKGKENE